MSDPHPQGDWLLSAKAQQRVNPAARRERVDRLAADPSRRAAAIPPAHHCIREQSHPQAWRPEPAIPRVRVQVEQPSAGAAWPLPLFAASGRVPFNRVLGGFQQFGSLLCGESVRVASRTRPQMGGGLAGATHPLARPRRPARRAVAHELAVPSRAFGAAWMEHPPYGRPAPRSTRAGQHPLVQRDQPRIGTES